MSATDDDLLRKAEQYLMEGSADVALSLLAQHLRQHPNSAQGWWLLSLAVSDQKQQVECLERVLRIDPAYPSARERLEKLTGTASSTPPFVSSDLMEETDHTPRDFRMSEPVTGKRPAPVPRKSVPRPKKKVSVLQYVILAAMGCFALALLGFVAVIAVQGYGSPAQPQPADSQSFTPILLPPTWTPTATVTLPPRPSATPLITDTPLFLMPTVQAQPTEIVPRSQVGPVVGYYAPDFSLVNINDKKKVKLSDLQGKAVVIFFWATWCPYCESEMPTVELMYKTYKDRGLEILAVDVGENPFLATSYRDSHKMTFPILDDPDRSAASLYRVTGFPTHFFVDQNGVISFIQIGTLNYWDFNTEVQKLVGATQ